MKRLWIILILILFSIPCLCAFKSYSTDSMSEAINNTRLNYGLSKVSESEKLEIFATKRINSFNSIKDLMKHKNFSKDLRSSGFEKGHCYGEVFAFNKIELGIFSSNDYVKALMASKKHKKVILDANYEYIGSTILVRQFGNEFYYVIGVEFYKW